MFLTVFLSVIIADIFSNVICSPIVVHDVSENESVENLRNDSNEDIPVPKVSRNGLYNFLHNRHFFQDIFSEHLAPLKFQFGHVCENPTEWEQRFEKKDFENNHHQGKVLWGNVNGNYGEHYWDLASGK